MNQELQIKTTIYDIEPQTSLFNNSPYYKLYVNWGTSNKVMFAFANNSNLDPTTLTNLADSSHNLINRPVLITYQEKGDYLHIQQIELLT